MHNNDGKLINNKLPFLKWLPAFWYLWRAVKKEKINHILVGHILPFGIVAYFIAKISGVSYSVFLHGMDLSFALKTKRKKWFAKKILNGSKNIICGNSYTAEMAKNIVKNGEKVIVINPGGGQSTINNQQSTTELKKKYNLENKVVLLSVGRLVKRKGFDKVIEALQEVLKDASNLIYVIVGNGPEMPNVGLKDEVILITDADDEEKNNWYDICDIFIMPAREIAGDFEGFGIVYLEANLAGKPVIAGNSGGVRDAVIDGVNGLLVNPESASGIAAAIIKLARDENLRKKLGEQGRERAIKDFGWKGQARKIYKLLISKS